MKIKKKVDVFELVRKFQATVLHKKPSLTEMVADVRLMRYKIRPLQGDISFLNVRDRQFIEALWSLGKLDELFQFHIEKLKPDDQETFFRLVNEMRFGFQHELSATGIHQEKLADTPFIFEMEIYKEQTQKVN